MATATVSVEIPKEKRTALGLYVSAKEAYVKRNILFGTEAVSTPAEISPMALRKN
jgi:hypothetical protein